MPHDDIDITRRIAAVNLGLLLGLLVLVAGPETVDLARTAAAQFLVLLTAVGTALLVEHRTRVRLSPVGR